VQLVRIVLLKEQYRARYARLVLHLALQAPYHALPVLPERIKELPAKPNVWNALPELRTIL
jgi:hypothetical protein